MLVAQAEVQEARQELQEIRRLVHEEEQSRRISDELLAAAATDLIEAAQGFPGTCPTRSPRRRRLRRPKANSSWV